MKFAMSYSFGKDSALGFYKMLQAGHEPVCLITAMNQEKGRSWSHGVRPEVIELSAAALGLPVVEAFCGAEDYGKAFEEALAQAAGKGAECCAFGDMDIEAHGAWNKARCAAAGLGCVMPLWGIARERAFGELIECGFTALITCVEKKWLAPEFLGKPLSKALGESIAAAGADVCGENGEYHTFVTGGPTYSNPVGIIPGPVIDLGEYAVLDIRGASI
ncbi:MAG: adenine nucleotide alpha hydrolase [Treponema sp.]|jgi:uncharacterized protein (TIGR00290 family)|nr:adenine nucleotide alpha hydrolase [Treponema sp.]